MSGKAADEAFGRVVGHDASSRRFSRKACCCSPGKNPGLPPSLRAGRKHRARFDHAAEANQVLVVDLVPVQQLGVIAEITQEPVKLPQCFRRAVEASHEGVARPAL